MAYYNNKKVQEQLHAIKMYEKLTIMLASPYTNPVTGEEMERHPYYDALSYLSDMKLELETLKSQISKYQEFFQSLKKFLNLDMSMSAKVYR